MKRTVAVSMGMAIFLIAVCGQMVRAEPFAPLVELTDEMLQEDSDAYLDAISARHSVIPSREEVGIPAFPSARILFTQMNIKGEMNGKPFEGMNRVMMGTPDPVAKVVEFYKENLPGWHYGEFYSVPTFWKGSGDFDPFEDLTTPRITIGPEYRTRDIMPESKTIVDIYYQTN